MTSSLAWPTSEVYQTVRELAAGAFGATKVVVSKHDPDKILKLMKVVDFNRATCPMHGALQAEAGRRKAAKEQELGRNIPHERGLIEDFLLIEVLVQVLLPSGSTSIDQGRMHTASGWKSTVL